MESLPIDFHWRKFDQDPLGSTVTDQPEQKIFIVFP